MKSTKSYMKHENLSKVAILGTIGPAMQRKMETIDRESTGKLSYFGVGLHTTVPVLGFVMLHHHLATRLKMVWPSWPSTTNSDGIPIARCKQQAKQTWRDGSVRWARSLSKSTIFVGIFLICDYVNSMLIRKIEFQILLSIKLIANSITLFPKLPFK